MSFSSLQVYRIHFFAQLIFLILTLTSSVKAAYNFECVDYFSDSLSCDQKSTTFDSEIISRFLGPKPVLLADRLDWSSRSSSKFFQCQRDASYMCLGLDVNVDEVYLSASSCKKYLTRVDNKIVFSLQQELFSNKIHSLEEFKLRLKSNSISSPYFSCFLKRLEGGESQDQQ